MTKPDERTQYLRIAEARRGIRNHAELAKETGINHSTVRKRFRLPGTATLDEVQAIVAGVLTPEEAWSLVNGGKKWRGK